MHCSGIQRAVLLAFPLGCASQVFILRARPYSMTQIYDAAVPFQLPVQQRSFTHSF